MKVAQLQNTETTTTTTATTTTPHCRWVWSQDCIDTPTFYSEFSPRHPPCFLNSPLSALLAAGSALGDPRGENTLLSPGSQGDCWKIPVYDFAAAVAAPGGWGGRLSVKKDEAKRTRKVQRKTCFFCSKATSLKFPKQFNKPQIFFLNVFVFGNMAIINKLCKCLKSQVFILSTLCWSTEGWSWSPDHFIRVSASYWTLRHF